MAKALNLPYREGFVKAICGPYVIARSALREKSVLRKLNAIEHEVRGKNVLLVDDSIVRGTTSAQIIEMARDVGAAKVYFASAVPPVRHPNVYGIDMPAVNEFIANGRTIEEINQTIGSDRLFYQTLEDLIDVTLQETSDVKAFDASCFNGEYIRHIDDAYLQNSTMLETMLPRANLTLTMPSSTFTTTKRFEPCTGGASSFLRPTTCRFMVSTRPVRPLVRPDLKVNHLALDESSSRLAWVEGATKVCMGQLDPGGEFETLRFWMAPHQVSYLGFHRDGLVVGDDLGSLAFHDLDGSPIETQDIDGGVQTCRPMGLKLAVLTGMGEVVLVQRGRPSVSLSQLHGLDDVVHVEVHDQRVFIAEQNGTVLACGGRAWSGGDRLWGSASVSRRWG